MYNLHKFFINGKKANKMRKFENYFCCNFMKHENAI